MFVAQSRTFIQCCSGEGHEAELRECHGGRACDDSLAWTAHSDHEDAQNCAQIDHVAEFSIVVGHQTVDNYGESELVVQQDAGYFRLAEGYKVDKQANRQEKGNDCDHLRLNFIKKVLLDTLVICSLVIGCLPLSHFQTAHYDSK